MLALTVDGKTLLVVNPDSNSVTLIDISSLATLTEIPVGEEPRAIAISAELAFVTNHGSDTVSIIDLQTQSLISDANGFFIFSYDPIALHEDFSMLSLTAHEGRRVGLADEVSINLLAVGSQPSANTITLIGEEIFVGSIPRGTYLPLVLRR